MDWEDSLEKGIATHSSILIWRIMGRGAWRVTVHEVAESDMTERLTLSLFKKKIVTSALMFSSLRI